MGRLARGTDELWVANDFVSDAFRSLFDGPITIVPPCVEVQIQHHYERDAFDMDPGIFYFIFSFDYLSCPARKNPLGVLRAFQAAFPDKDERVGLVIKSTNARAQHYPEVTTVLIEAAHEDRRIKIIDRILSRDEVLSLVRQSDCYVSLHRAEGFGLGMAEAMAFGMPVIGTNYSGNTDFLSESTGFPVPYTLRPVQPGEFPFEDGQFWAEPDEATAAVIMRRIFDDPQERQIRGAAGKAFIETRYSRKNVGEYRQAPFSTNSYNALGKQMITTKAGVRCIMQDLGYPGHL